MDFLPEVLQHYAEAHTSEESDLLKELDRETYAKVLMPRMLSGHIQGRVLSMFSHMKRPKNILEIGTYTGYSAICMAEGLQEGGQIDTIDINEELEDMIRGYIEKAGLGDTINLHIGPAVDIIPRLDKTFDLVFIDADKLNYSRYFDLVIERVNPGGIILADNVLWSGKVVDAQEQDEDTRGLREFNEKVQQDDRVENVLFPIRDGIMVIRKR